MDLDAALKELKAGVGIELFDFLTRENETTKQIRRGAISELIACAWFLAQGYDVFRNVSPHGDADIVVRKDGRTIPVDIKSARPTGELGANRKHQAAIIARGIEVVYVFRDGKCKWGRDIDPLYGRVRDPKVPSPPPDPVSKICLGCGKQFFLTNPRRPLHQKYCVCKCSRAARQRIYGATRRTKMREMKRRSHGTA